MTATTTNATTTLATSHATSANTETTEGQQLAQLRGHLANQSPDPIKDIYIDAMTWRDKTYGNTYSSAQVFINYDYAFSIPFQYGGTGILEDTIYNKLTKLGMFNGLDYSLRRACRDNEIRFTLTEKPGTKRDTKTHGLDQDATG